MSAPRKQSARTTGDNPPPAGLAKHWQPLFALLCLSLAAWHLFAAKPVDNVGIALLVLATAPWSLAWVAGLVTSVKVGGVELQFKDRLQAVEQAQAAVPAMIQLGVGGAETAAKTVLKHLDSAATAPDAYPPGEEPAVLAATPPAGGKPTTGSRKLEATVTPFPGSDELYVVHAGVVSTDPVSQPLDDNGDVVFHLNSTFKQPELRKRITNGTATMDCVARGAFVLGATVNEAGRSTRLDLDLANIPGAFPAR